MLPDRDSAQELEDPPVSANMFPPILGLVGIGLLAWVVWVFGLLEHQPADELPHCRSIADERGRLACYDGLTVPQPPAKGAVAPIHTLPQEGPR